MFGVHSHECVLQGDLHLAMKTRLCFALLLTIGNVEICVSWHLLSVTGLTTG